MYSDDTQIQCDKIIELSQYNIFLHPKSKAVDMYNKFNPICLDPKKAYRDDLPRFYLYCQTGSEKEDWFVVLKRVSKLPQFADEEALTAFYNESEPVRNYTAAMEKLIENTIGSVPNFDSTCTNSIADSKKHKTCTDSIADSKNHNTAWLNAIVGRMFVSIHTNPQVKEWLTSRLSRGSMERTEEGFLGDIQIKNLYVGNSLPVLSNPNLLSISVDGDLMVLYK
jgi:hypothetical protein